MLVVGIVAVWRFDTQSTTQSLYRAGKKNKAGPPADRVAVDVLMEESEVVDEADQEGEEEEDEGVGSLGEA